MVSSEKYIDKAKKFIYEHKLGISVSGSLVGLGYLASHVYAYSADELTELLVNGAVLAMLIAALAIDYKSRENSYTGIGSKEHAHHGVLITY